MLYSQVIFKLNKLNTYAIFGAMFLAATLLASGMYSTNQIFAEENQTGTENEAEVKADIEQENKCKKDSECENENEINNTLNITTITTTAGNGDGNGDGTPEDECALCFTAQPDGPWQNGQQLEDFETYLEEHEVLINGQDVDSIAELCKALVESEEPVFFGNIADAIEDALDGSNSELMQDVFDCLSALGLVFWF